MCTPVLNNVPPDNFHDIISAHTAQKYKYNQAETLKDRYNTSKHCPFYHKNVPNGFNIYLAAEQYINPVSPSANIYASYDSCFASSAAYNVYHRGILCALVQG
jgi:hypothetical protein